MTITTPVIQRLLEGIATWYVDGCPERDAAKLLGWVREQLAEARMLPDTQLHIHEYMQAKPMHSRPTVERVLNQLKEAQ